MTKIEFYTSVSAESGPDKFEAVEQLLIHHFEGFTVWSGYGRWKREPLEETYIYTVFSPKPADNMALVKSIAAQIACQFGQETVLYFVSTGEGGFS